MASIIVDLQDALLSFVKQKVSPHKWEYLTRRSAIENELAEDCLSDLKDHFFDELMNAVRWSEVVDDIEEMVRMRQEEDGEEGSPHSSDEEA